MDTLSILEEDLRAYREHWQPGPETPYQNFQDFIHSTTECCERTHQSGHCTGSALIVDPTGSKTLLLFHPFLKRWLQPGGHADGSFDLQAVAHREAEEETGLSMASLIPARLGDSHRTPLDMDIHAIPARPERKEAAHYHYDLRFLFIADPALALSPESPDMKLSWMPLGKVEAVTSEESVLRMIRKVQKLPRRADGSLEL